MNDADEDGMDDPMCGKPWAEHSRIGDCPQDPDDRWSLRWVGIILLVLTAVIVAAAVTNH